MKHFTATICIMSMGLAGGAIAWTGDNPAPSAVLAELFTSEGCSSCPPADRLLEALDRVQPVPGARIIVLSEHVDYWDHLGWKDPFSSAAFSSRQHAYGRRFRLNSVYTPQLVIDGREQVLGSDIREVRAAATRAAATPRLPMLISQARREGDFALFHLEVPPLPQASSYARADVWVAIADEQGTSQVGRGENSGRRLSHTAVARRIAVVGEVTKSQGFRQDLKFAAGGGAGRIIAVLQQRDFGPVAGVDFARF
ncbi:MAG: DUF1223 domain-containing protein [Acidobacteria bacterium]|nr:DUF1223 domain-containing protein [Acidobacteriota bacterium]